jgi:hypothetical protein
MDGDWFSTVLDTPVELHMSRLVKGDLFYGRFFRLDDDGYDTVEFFEYDRPRTFVTLGPDATLVLRHSIYVGPDNFTEKFRADSFGNDACLVRVDDYDNRMVFKASTPEITYEFESFCVCCVDIVMSLRVRDVPRANALLDGVHAHFAGMCTKHLGKTGKWSRSVVMEAGVPSPRCVFGLRLLTR